MPRPLVYKENTSGTEFGLYELTDSQLELLSYLVRARYAEKLADISSTTSGIRGQIYLKTFSNSAPRRGTTSDYFSGSFRDSRRDYALSGNLSASDDRLGSDLFSGPSSAAQLTVEDVPGATLTDNKLISNFGPAPSAVPSYTTGGYTFTPRSYDSYMLYQRSAQELTPSDADTNENGFLIYTSRSLKPAGKDRSVITELLSDCYTQMKTGDGVGTYYVDKSTATKPGGQTNGTFVDMGTFFIDTRSQVSSVITTSMTIDADGYPRGKNYGSVVEQHNLPNMSYAWGVVVTYNYWVKTEDTAFDVSGGTKQFSNLMFLKNDGHKLLRKDRTSTSAPTSTSDLKTKYGVFMDMIDKVIIPQFANGSDLPTYYKTNNNPPSPASKIRGTIEDTYYAGTNTYLYRSTSGLTYKRLDIPKIDNNNVFTTTMYWYINN